MLFFCSFSLLFFRRKLTPLSHQWHVFVQNHIGTLGVQVITSSLVNSNDSFADYFGRNVNVCHGLHVVQVASTNLFQSELGLFDLDVLWRWNQLFEITKGIIPNALIRLLK